MSDDPTRLPLPRGAFRLADASDKAAGAPPTVVTPDYGDRGMDGAQGSKRAARRSPPSNSTGAGRRPRDPFDAYGDRTASRPFALRLPDPIDLALRQIAAERHTQPLRIVDQALHEFLVKLGKLPATPRG